MTVQVPFGAFAGSVPSHCLHCAACGSVSHAPRFWQTYGVWFSAQVEMSGQWYAHESGALTNVDAKGSIADEQSRLEPR